MLKETKRRIKEIRIALNGQPNPYQFDWAEADVKFLLTQLDKSQEALRDVHDELVSHYNRVKCSQCKLSLKHAVEALGDEE